MNSLQVPVCALCPPYHCAFAQTVPFSPSSPLCAQLLHLPRGHRSWVGFSTRTGKTYALIYYSINWYMIHPTPAHQQEKWSPCPSLSFSRNISLALTSPLGVICAIITIPQAHGDHHHTDSIVPQLLVRERLPYQLLCLSNSLVPA